MSHCLNNFSVRDTSSLVWGEISKGNHNCMYGKTLLAMVGNTLIPILILSQRILNEKEVDSDMELFSTIASDA